MHVCSCVCLAGAISIYSPQRSLIRSVQDDVIFSVNFTCSEIPNIQWTFMSGLVSRMIGTWQPGGYTNITEDYSSRVQAYDNGSMCLSDLRLQDGGFYVVTITESTGSSKDFGFVLKVNGETLYIKKKKQKQKTNTQRGKTGKKERNSPVRTAQFLKLKVINSASVIPVQRISSQDLKKQH